MSLCKRAVVVGLALAFALSLLSGAASAATKKKKEEKKKEQPRTTHHAEKNYLSGTNAWGRPGLLYGDTSETVGKNNAVASLHGLWQALPGFSFGPISAGGNIFIFPLGADFGLDKDFDLDLGAAFLLTTYSVTGGGISTSTSSSSFSFTGGGKYHFGGETKETPDFSLGADITFPTSTTVSSTSSGPGGVVTSVGGYYGAGGTVIVTPKGTISYTLSNGMLLNGELGINISTVTWVLFDAGVGYPINDKWTAIGEIGANQFSNGFSFLGLGARGDLGGIKGQAIIGIPLNGGGVQLGLGAILGS